MKYLKVKELPKKLSQFRSLKDVVTASIDARLIALAKLQAYPVPGHVLGHVRSYLSPATNLTELKSQIIRLRDAVKYASEILSNLSLVQFEKFQLDYAKLQTHIVDSAPGYGYSNLFTDKDFAFIVHLILTNEIKASSWSLDLDPNASDNLIIQLGERYKEIREGMSYNVQSGVNANSIAKVRKANYASGIIKNEILEPLTSKLPSAYLVDEDAVESVVMIPGIQSMVLEATRSSQFSNDETRAQFIGTVISNESTFQRLADIRLVDHLVALLTSIDIWSVFITPRPKSDPAHNIERANSLRDFAAYLHSLLVYPYILRSELFIQSYNRIEAWYGAMPVVPEEDYANYKKFVQAYDVLKASSDANALFSTFETTLNTSPGSEISTHFEELLHIYGIDAVTQEAIALMGSVPNLDFSDLQVLKDKTYDSLLMSLPLAKFKIIGDIYSRLIQQQTFSHTLKLTIESILPAHTRFYNDQIIDKVASLNLVPHFSWCAKLVNFPGIDQQASVISDELGAIVIPYGHIIASRTNEMTIQRDYLMTMKKASSFSQGMFAPFIFDGSIAARLREQTSLPSSSFFPAQFMKGSRGITTPNLKSDKFAVEALISLIFDQNFSYAEKFLNIDVAREKWATLMSGFCLLYVTTDNQPTLEPQFPGKAITSDLTLVPGLGKPYGMSYGELESLQNFENADFIPVTKYVSLALLKKIPVPSQDMEVAEFSLGIPYYSFSANGGHVLVDEFVIGPSLLQFTARPFSHLDLHTEIVYDKLYAYSTDALVIQADPNVTLSPSSVPSFPSPVSKTDWNQDKMSLNLEFFHFPNFSAQTHAAQHADSNPLADLNKKLEDEFNNISKEADVTTKIKSDKIGSVIHDSVKEIQKVTEVDRKTNQSKSGGGDKHNKSKSKDKGKPNFNKGKNPDASIEADFDSQS